ncbi:carbohydrate ABC transporter permease [Paenibacillus physcomitrellae]|uniref:ABC transporter permease protein YtcP n=1 Tax=Paenibacillus physcomitrellae TaxID=1619311 RepID=A0ABQ1FXR1_9BACL|nr:carbohydrate ABC transporter permease [Paenibacillus physcomitrellae]GGA31006.1 putative ABC transporter permease protein YtcP [Paenibacillus physcomitrellae]
MKAANRKPSISQTSGGRAFELVNMGIILVLVILCLAPLLHIASMSLSSNRAILSGEVTVFPLEINLEAYRKIFQDNSMIRSLLLTVALTAGYTGLSMLMTIFAAYPLSKRLKGGKPIMFFIIFTMFFSGGTIPDYLLIRSLHLTNHLGSLLLPTMINPFFLIILITFLRSLPAGLLEAAEMDGSSHFHTLIRIVLPLSLPALATLSLFYAVGRWNGFMDALMYITDPRLYPIQLKLYQVVMNSMTNDPLSMQGDQVVSVLPEGIKAASIMFATVPILLVYPWLQKYFISGVMIGAVKE